MKKSKLAKVAASVVLSVSIAAATGVSAITAVPMIKIKPNTTTSYPTGYSPAKLRTAYGLDKISGTGAGQTIALINAYGNPNMASDLTTFDNYYGLSTANLTVHKMGTLSTDAGWAMETSLDVEWAHAMAPDAKILLVEATSASNSALLSAIDYANNNGATAISMSWGGSESKSETTYDSHFSHSGTLYFASSGDDGAGAEWPAASTKVIAVGGTTLTLDSNGNRISETAWSGSGGGVSSYESEPTWQQNLGISTYRTKRAIPDVALDADPNTGASVYCSVSQSDGTSGWYTVGGTSLSSPATAGIVSDLNESGSVITGADSFYDLAGTYDYTNSYDAFNDVTSGDNGYYYADTGYDAVTGLGSPEADKILAAQ